MRRDKDQTEPESAGYLAEGYRTGGEIEKEPSRFSMKK